MSLSLKDLIHFLPICIIALAILVLFWWLFGISLFRSVDRNLRRCPNCKRSAVGMITDTDIESLGVRIDRNKLTSFRYKKEIVTDHYQCTRCGHTWTRAFQREEQLPVRKTPTSWPFYWRGNSGVAGKNHLDWMSQLEILKENLEKIMNNHDIKIQRKAFALFNAAFYKSIKQFGLSDVITYYQYCPMAIDDKGAYWLSEIKEISNPYFGDKMLRCGETRETLE